MPDPVHESAPASDEDETEVIPGGSPSRLIRNNADRIVARMLGESSTWVEEEGDSIGPYRLCELLGEGGFGNVWRAEQTEVVKREVAVKVIKLGMDTAQVLGRFDQERQALASLDHPSIATMLDAGVSPNGRPYFAMELVRGGVITSWCESSSASVPERLRLFIQVCQAVQHAHEKGILHRDLKPSNVLVTEIDGRPVPKVIDFGIAKAMHSDSLADPTMLTQGDQVIGTPIYMSPEQIEGGRTLDPRSDVYALGVLLYELLTGVQPFDTTSIGKGGIAAVKHLILETIPERPSTRVRQKTTASRKAKTGFQTRLSALPADLDWITMRALEKDRLRRYQTATEFAADVQRHLDNMPVVARPPNLSYKAGRWIRRHRRGVLTASLGAVTPLALILAAMQLEKESHKLKPIKLAVGETYTNIIGMKFAPVPGTDVLFCIHETRNKDFAAFAADVPGAVNLWVNGVGMGLDPVIENREEHPAMRLNWDEARAFCRWLTQKEGRTYRLPTDCEWSLAVGIGEQEKWTAETTPKSVFKAPDHYPWEGPWPPPPGAGNYCDLTHHAKRPTTLDYLLDYEDGYETTAPVMKFKPNKLGLYDMGGNVAEWVEDWWDGTKKERVLRGGFWSASPKEAFKETMLSSMRVIRAYTPAIKNPNYGFRCVLVPDGKEPPQFEPLPSTAK